MTTPPYSELVAAVRREGAGILAAAQLGLDAPVTTCPDWDVEALVRHIVRVYTTAEYVVSHRPSQRPEEFPPVPDGEPGPICSLSSVRGNARASGARRHRARWPRALRPAIRDLCPSYHRVSCSRMCLVSSGEKSC